MPLLTKSFLAPVYRRPNVNGFIYIQYAVPPHSARITEPASFSQSLIGFHLLTSVCNAWQRSRTQNLQRVGRNSGPVLSRSWIKFMKYSDDIRDLSITFQRPCLLSIPSSCRRYSPLSLEVVENRTNVYSF